MHGIQQLDHRVDKGVAKIFLGIGDRHLVAIEFLAGLGKVFDRSVRVWRGLVDVLESTLDFLDDIFEILVLSVIGLGNLLVGKLILNQRDAAKGSLDSLGWSGRRKRNALARGVALSIGIS